MRKSYALILSSFFVFTYASDVKTKADLSFFGEYVIFRPKSQFIKFDLLEEVDILLLEHYTTKPNLKTREKETLYRIRLNVDDSAATENVLKVKCTIQHKGKVVLEGQYELWNQTEKNNMAVSWGTNQRVIDVLTELDGNHNSIFSWKDRTKNRTSVKYVGLAVASLSPGANHSDSDHRHLTWKIREAEPAEVDVSNAYRICDVRLLSGDPRSDSSNGTILYQISVTHEDDETFLITMQKRNEEVLRATSNREIDGKSIVLSWDAEDNVICFGQKNDMAPLFLWHDPSSEKAFNNVTHVNIEVPYANKSSFVKVRKEKFKTIPELFPRYFTDMRNGKIPATMMMMTTTTTGANSASPSSGGVSPQPKTVGYDNSFMNYD